MGIVTTEKNQLEQKALELQTQLLRKDGEISVLRQDLQESRVKVDDLQGKLTDMSNIKLQAEINKQEYERTIEELEQEIRRLTDRGNTRNQSQQTEIEGKGEKSNLYKQN